MTVRIGNIAFDCEDVLKVASFWSGSSLDYNEMYELTSDMARRLAANLAYWASRVAAAVTARNRHAGVPAPGSGTRTFRTSKPWPAPHAASRAHPPQPGAGTATDTRTAPPA